MIGLLLKDLYTLRQYGRSMLFMIVFFALLSSGLDNPATFFEGFIILMCMMMTISSFSYDSLAKWDRYALSLPVSRKEIVGSKYLLSIVLCLIGTGVSYLVSSVVLAINPVDGFGMTEQMFSTMAIISAAMFITGILLPLTFQFGVEKSRLFMIAVLAVPSAAIIAMDKIGLPIPTEESLLNILKLLPAAAILFYLLSYFLSVKIFSGKEF